MDHCPSCDSKDRLIEFLNQQLQRAQTREDVLTDHVVNLADQQALARLRGPQPRVQTTEESAGRPPVRSQYALRQRRDVMSEQEIRSLQPAEDAPREPSIESSFKLPES